MKTVIKMVIEENDSPSSYIKRVSDSEAITLVKTSEWDYASKELKRERNDYVVRNNIYCSNNGRWLMDVVFT